VAIWAPNSWQWIVAALGAQSVGAAIVPVNTRYTGREAAYVLERSAPRVLVIVSTFLGRDYPGMLKDVGFAPADGARMVLLDEVKALDQLASDRDLDERIDELEGTDDSDVLFTSGTTGSPKGVITTHAQNLRAYYDWSALAGIRSEDRYAIVNPFFHAFGYKAGWLSSLMHGATIYPHATLDPARLMDQVASERITVLPGPPTLYLTLLERGVGGRDLSSLRLAITGAASIPPELVRRLRAEFGFERVTTCYGMTEGTGVATITRAEDDLEVVAGTSGQALPDIEVRVVDEEGQPVQTGATGEVWLRGYNVMRGYIGEPAASATSVGESGWLRTGDVGVLDEHGRLRVTDRKGDMFVVGGFNAYPAEIENVLSEHPDVAEIAVVGMPDDRMGEVGCAFVVPATGAVTDTEALVEWARQRLANFKVPRRIVFVRELPRNATGKVLKDSLRRAAAADPEIVK